MPPDEPFEMDFTLPAEARFLRPLRLAVGGLATLVGFDVEAIDDLRIGVDELCGALIESGDGTDLRVRAIGTVGTSLRLEATAAAGEGDADADRLEFSRRLLSVVADDHGLDLDDGTVSGWLVRAPS